MQTSKFATTIQFYLPIFPYLENQKKMITRPPRKSNIVIGILIAAVASLLIGLIFTVVFGGSLKMPLKSYLWDAGYSLSIGLPLFANKLVFLRYEKYFIDWYKKPIKSLVGALILQMLYSSIVIWTVNWFWFVVAGKQETQNFWQHNAPTIISEYIIFIIIAAIIYASSFFKAWRNEIEQKEKVKREALSLQYKVLQDQINPHFLFNSLNVLGSLIDMDVPKAKTFTRELSTFYRHLLQLKNYDIIPLKEEIDFVKKYIYLQQIRFGDALQVDIIANEKISGKVIPLSLQALVENAIKHNEVSIDRPLKIVIAISDDYELVVENNLQLKRLREQPSLTGLKNLAGRYEYLTGKEMKVSKNQHYFRVSIPLIQLEDDTE